MLTDSSGAPLCNQNKIDEVDRLDSIWRRNKCWSFFIHKGKFHLSYSSAATGLTCFPKTVKIKYLIYVKVEKIQCVKCHTMEGLYVNEGAWLRRYGYRFRYCVK